MVTEWCKNCSEVKTNEIAAIDSIWQWQVEYPWLFLSVRSSTTFSLCLISHLWENPSTQTVQLLPVDSFRCPKIIDKWTFTLYNTKVAVLAKEDKILCFSTLSFYLGMLFSLPSHSCAIRMSWQSWLLRTERWVIVISWYNKVSLTLIFCLRGT